MSLESLPYNVENPYSYHYDDKQVYELPEYKQNSIIQDFLNKKALIKKYIGKFSKKSSNIYTEDNITPEVIKLWKKCLKEENFDNSDTIDLIDDLWKIDEDMNLISEDGIYLDEYFVNIDGIEYDLYDIYSYPGDNQWGFIFVKYNDEYYTVFDNSDMNINIICSDPPPCYKEILKIVDKIRETMYFFEKYRINRLDSPLDEIYENGNTQLIIAAKMGLKKVVEFLIQQGADVNVINNDGKSYLDFYITF